MDLYGNGTIPYYHPVSGGSPSVSGNNSNNAYAVNDIDIDHINGIISSNVTTSMLSSPSQSQSQTVGSTGITSVMEWSECTQNDVLSSDVRRNTGTTNTHINTNNNHIRNNNTINISNNGGGAAAIGSVNDLHQQHNNHHIHRQQHHQHQHHQQQNQQHHTVISAAPTIKNHSVTHFNGYLYCFGGYDGRRNHMTLLLYSIKQQRWIRPYHATTTTTTTATAMALPIASTSSTSSLSPILESQSSTDNNNNNNTAGYSSSAIHAATSAVSSITNRAAVAAFNHHTVGGGGIHLYNHNNTHHHPASTSSGSSNNNSIIHENNTSIVVHGTPPPGRNGHSATLAIDPDDDQMARIIIIGGWLGTGPLAASDMHILDIAHINNNRHRRNNNNHSSGIICGSNPHDDIDDRSFDNNNNFDYDDDDDDDNCQQVLQWYQPAMKGTPPGACNMHSADYVTNRKEVYVFRGGNGREYLNDLHALNVDTLTWRKVLCSGTIPQQRANHSSAILDKVPGSKTHGSELFIFGGWNGTERLNDIHILDTDTSTWTAPHISGVLPHPRAGMTLTALRGRLYLFGGSGTSAKCFQDLQILDRQEMAWLDVVPEEEKGSCNNSSTSPNNGNSNNNEGGTGVTTATGSDNYLNDNRFRFGGNRMYGSDNNGVLFDDYGASDSTNVNRTSLSSISRPQNADRNISSGNTSDDLWRGVGQDSIDPVRRYQHHQQHQQMMYTSPNPNDEDTVPSVLIRGHGPGRRAGHTATAVNRKIYVFGGSCGSDYLNDFFVLDTDPPPSATVTEANPLVLMERRLRHFFNDPEFADVVFVVGDHQDKVYGHKMVLSIVSDCFRAMFTTGFKEADAMEINLPDCTHAAFLAIMEYIYTGALPSILRQYHTQQQQQQQQISTRQQHQQHQHNNWNNTIINAQSLPLVVEILELADRFFLDHLKQVCERILEMAVNGETVEFLLTVAQKSNSMQLLSICQHYCRNNHIPQSSSTSLLLASTTTTTPSASSSSLSNFSTTVHHLNQIHYSNETIQNVNPNDDIVPLSTGDSTPIMSNSSSSNNSNDNNNDGCDDQRLETIEHINNSYAITPSVDDE